MKSILPNKVYHFPIQTNALAFFSSATCCSGRSRPSLSLVPAHKALLLEKLDGDLVVVERRESAQNGETVVALVDGEQATLKRYYREGSRIRLQPANPEMEPIIVGEDRVRVQGVVVGLMRKY